MVIRRSRNSYIRWRRRVTLQPMFIPSRSLKVAIDLRALVITGFWPAIAVSSATAIPIFLESDVASPTPMLITILSRRGASREFAYENSLISEGRTTFS